MADNGSSKSPRDVDDISLDDARPARKPSRGGAVVVVIVLIVLVAVIAVVYVNKKKAAEEAKQQAQAAAVTRQAQMDVVKRNLQAAYDLSAAGNVEAAIDKLGVADAQLGVIVSNANSEKNNEAATQALNQKKYISDAYNALQTKKQELQAVAMDQFTTLAAQFNLQPPAPVSTPTPTEATPAVTGSEAPVTPPASSTPATGTETAPAAPTTSAPPAASATPGAPGMPAASSAPSAAPAPVAPAAS